MEDTFCLTFSVEMDFFGDLRTLRRGAALGGTPARLGVGAGVGVHPQALLPLRLLAQITHAHKHPLRHTEPHLAPFNSCHPPPA